MTTATPEKWIRLAMTLADAAGEVARKYFRTAMTADIKADQSFVTIADREIERMLRERLAAELPDHGILGEEEDTMNIDAEYVWTLDPIDGTASFITGKPLFTTLISLAHHGTPILGVIDQPHLRERWVGGNGIPATLNNTPTRTRPCASLEDAILATTSPYLFSATDRVHFEGVREKCGGVSLGGDGYAYGLLASGFVDIVMESGLKPYDFCPLVPVIESAGGIMTDWQGNPLTLHSGGHVLACGDKAQHQEILKLLGA